MIDLSRAKSIGIFGGSFNPPHNGHMFVANGVKEAFELDAVLFMVANDPPHKRISGSPARTRLALAEAAAEGNDYIAVSDIELVREGKSYTVDTVCELKRLYPAAKLYLIVGADMLLTLHLWREPERFLPMCDVIAVARPGIPDDLIKSAERLSGMFGAHIHMAEFEGPDISSTTVRERVYEAKPISKLVPSAVERLVYLDGLYQPDYICGYIKRLSDTIKPKRLEHSIGAMRTAIELAERFNIDAQKTRIAALLHDCGKLQDDELISLANEFGIHIDEFELAHPGLLHASVGARIAKRDYGVHDPEILRAIEAHTLCTPEMTKLMLAVYVADKIEPTRDYPGVDILREAAESNLESAALLCMENVVAHLEATGQSVQPDIFKAIESLKKQMEGKI